MRRGRALDVDALYARHHDDLRLFLVRRTADAEVALDLWAETFAQAVAGHHRFRGTSEGEAAAWLYSIARRQLALYLRRGSAERRALEKLGLERPTADEELLAEIEERARLDVLRSELAVALATLSEPVREAVRRRIVEDATTGTRRSGPRCRSPSCRRSNPPTRCAPAPTARR